MMGVDNELLHAGGGQVIKRKSYERLLKNWQKRLGHIIRQRPQARPKTGAKHESAFNGWYAHLLGQVSG